MGAPEGSIGIVSGLKRLGRWGHGLASSDRRVEMGIECGTPGYKATLLKRNCRYLCRTNQKRAVLLPAPDMDIH